MYLRRTMLALICCFSLPGLLVAQTSAWTLNLDTVSLFTSPQLSDFNADGVLDVVVGGGLEGVPSQAGITAINGANGQVLWQLPARDQVFGTALLRDITGDSIDEVFIGGRDALLFCINGSTGVPVWEFWPDSLGPAVMAGWYQFYNAQWVSDQDQDGIPDLLISHGGDRNAAAFDSLRPPGSLMLISAGSGVVIAQDTMPDGHESYFSPLLLDVDGTGNPFIIFGSGGETVRGRLWASRLSDLRNSDLSAASILLDDSFKGMIASPSLADLNADAVPDLIVPELNGRLTALSGDGFAPLWSLDFPGYEMYTAPTIGQFTGDATPDVFAIASRGQWSFYSGFLEFVVDGATGQIAWTDSATHYQFSQANAVDRDGDGFDEILLNRNRDIGFSMVEYRNRFRWIDINDNQVQEWGPLRNGLNIFTTSILADLDGDQNLDLVHGYHPQTGNWAGQTDAVIERIDLGLQAVYVAWPGYMGRDRDGYYHPPTAVGAIAATAPETVQVFPHPVRDLLRITGGSAKALRLRDLQGRLLLEVRDSDRMPVSGVVAGLYLLEIESRNGRQHVRVVVE